MKNLFLILVALVIMLSFGQQFRTTSASSQKLSYVFPKVALDTQVAGNKINSIELDANYTDVYFHYKNVSDTTTDSVVLSNVLWWGNVKQDSIIVAGTPTTTTTLTTLYIIPPSTNNKWLLNEKFIDKLYIQRINRDSGSVDQSDVDSAFVSAGNYSRED